MWRIRRTSEAADILTFTLPEQVSGATIDTENHTVVIEATFGTDISSLIPSITISEFASIDPLSGATVDFSSPVVFTVTSEFGNTQDWTVSVSTEINESNQTITFNPIKDQFFETGTLTLSATASSGLEVSYDVVSGPASVTGNTLTFTDLGTVVIRASQMGNSIFVAATSVEQTFEIISVTGVDDAANNVLIYPNPASNMITVQTQEANLQIRLININGTEVMSFRPNLPNSISHLEQGVYFLRIANAQQTTTHKIIKN